MDLIKDASDTGAIANYPTPEQAARVLASLVKYRSMQFASKTNTQG